MPLPVAPMNDISLLMEYNILIQKPAATCCLLSAISIITAKELTAVQYSFVMEDLNRENFFLSLSPSYFLFKKQNQ